MTGLMAHLMQAHGAPTRSPLSRLLSWLKGDRQDVVFG